MASLRKNGTPRRPRSAKNAFSSPLAVGFVAQNGRLEQFKDYSDKFLENSPIPIPLSQTIQVVERLFAKEAVLPEEGSRYKITIVEDETIIARDIAMQLNRWGFEVVGISTNADEAFRQIERHEPDIVLMDIGLRGEMDGISAAENIRKRYSLPVIYLTAHTEAATLERATHTYPFGYIVKPFGENTNMKPLLLMALRKHRMEREVEKHRQMLSTTLESVADAVIVTDPLGEILFLNRTAERLTGCTQEVAAGNSLANVAPIEDEHGRCISLQLIQTAMAKNEPIHVPRGSALIGRGGRAVEVTGHFSVTRDDKQQTAGVFITLQDAAAQRREEQRIRQEQQMRVAGELARGVAHEFYALAGLVEESVLALNAGGGASELDLIRRASEIGKEMSLQLMDLGAGQGASHAVNVRDCLLRSQPLLERCCRIGVTVEISAEDGLGYVVSTGNHFEQLLMHLCLNGRHFLNGDGKITITAGSRERQITPARSQPYVRMAFLSEKPAIPSEEIVPMPFGIQPPDVNLSIARAIAIASEGFSKTTEVADSVSLVEVFLPRHASRASAIAATSEHSRVLLLAALSEPLVEAVRRAAGDDAALLEAADIDQASLIAELYAGDFDLIIVNAPTFGETGARNHDGLRARRPSAGFVRIGEPGGWPDVHPPDPTEVEQRVAAFFHQRAVGMSASSG